LYSIFYRYLANIELVSVDVAFGSGTSCLIQISFFFNEQGGFLQVKEEVEVVPILVEEQQEIDQDR
jgi:hypothetical protein